MKNLIILGASFVVLFVAAAGGMHLWLQQNKTTTADNKDPKDDKKGKEEPKDKGIKEPAKPKTPDKEPAKDDDPATKLALKLEKEAIRNRELRLEKRQSQLELILQDIRTERDEADKLNKQAAVELKRQEDLRAQAEALRKQDEDAKAVAGKGSGFGVGAAPLPPKPADLPDPNEKKNIEKMAVMFESMAPETAAKIAQQMADSGKMGIVVKVLLQMRERSAGRLIEQIPDPALAGQLLDAIGKTKRPPVVPTAAVTPPG